MTLTDLRRAVHEYMRLNHAHPTTLRIDPSALNTLLNDICPQDSYRSTEGEMVIMGMRVIPDRELCSHPSVYQPLKFPDVLHCPDCGVNFSRPPSLNNRSLVQFS